MGLKVPFSVHVTKATFEQLDDLLQRVCEGLDGPSDWPPPQEKECMAVSGLNLLRLQVSWMDMFKHVYKTNGIVTDCQTK